VYVLQFPHHLWPKLQPVFKQQGITAQVASADDRIVVHLGDDLALLLKMHPVFERIGPIGGWAQSYDNDRPSTPPFDGFGF